MVDEKIQKLLQEVAYHFDDEDRSVRYRQIRTARRLKLLWDGFQRTWYSEVAHDWRIFDEDQQSDDTNQDYYNKPVNVFRAYLESIIAALSITVPPIKCFPDDADDPLDLATAKAGDKIAQLVYRHNNVSLLWVHALFIYCTEGLVASYNYVKSDKKFGTYTEEQTENDTEEYEYLTCPNCGYEFSKGQVDPLIDEKIEEVQNEFAPEDIELQNFIQSGNTECPNCLQQVLPTLSKETLTVPRIVGKTVEPKSRVCVDAFGLLYVKVANYAKKQCDTPYLIHSVETHYANVVERYEHLHGKFGKDFREKVRNSGGPKDPYEQWSRLSTQYRGEYPLDTVTVRSCWLRPAAFNILKDKADVDTLKKLFPDGCYVVFANENFAEACNADLDDDWTLTYNPLADYLNHDPIGLLLVSIQEITNDLVSLTLQTIEHGIGQTFADPAVLNFNAYGQTEAVPGGVYEATPKTGKSVGDAFYEMKTAVLSGEVMPFAQQIQTYGQLVSGALPSLFGGQLEGSETASQYSMSRAQALQRLQNVWKVFCSWWKETFGKVIPRYIKEVKEDEHDVELDKSGNFINVFIRKAELSGKIGKVELEANENLPLTWSQQKDVIMEIFKSANPQLLALLTDPENLPAVKNAIGLDTISIPGEDSRNKQYEEIKILLQSGPMPSGDMLNPEVSTVDVDPDFDKNEVEFAVIQHWVNDEAGRLAKIENPDGYKNVLLHGREHLMVIQQKMMQAAMASAGAPEGNKPNELDREAPIMGEQNVSTVQ